MKKPETIEEMEKRDAGAYARIPSQASEFEEWESEQFWDDEEGEPEEITYQPGTIDKETKTMKEAFRKGGRNSAQAGRAAAQR